MASELIVQTIQGPSSGANANKVLIPSGHTLDASTGFIPPAGHVINTQQVYFGDSTALTASNTYIACTGSDCVITAKLSNSKFLVRVHITVYLSGSGKPANVGIYRDTTLIAGTSGTGGDAWAGAWNFGTTPSSTLTSDSAVIVREYLDSPSVAAGTSLTYKAALGAWGGTGTVTANYPGYSNKSSITVMEIAQ